MIEFDKIKIVSSIENVKSLNEDVFENKVKNGCIVEHISQVMKHYRVLAAKLSKNLSPSLKQQVRNLLLEVLILFGIFI